MNFHFLALTVAILFGITIPVGASSDQVAQPTAFAGSESCRECHEKFHNLWATSRHGRSVFPFTDEFANKELVSQKEDISIGAFRYRADISPGAGKIVETGADGKKECRIEYALGGKGLYSFLTTFEDGRIEALPLAYDIRKKEWYEAENSSDSPLPPGVTRTTPMDWKKRPFSFSDACPSCHVSRFTISHDPATKRYSESWSEPGVNCETCHGSSVEHNKAMRALKKGETASDTKIISTKRMNHTQRNDLCTTCHTKQTALTGKYIPGERYLDHFDLITLENPDYYPDGRDHGENYTTTGWIMSECYKSGKMDCMHCHTSSGRYRFKSAEKANDACLPCHAERVKNAAAHTHHKADGPGSRCVSCHMPKTTFARMERSDHSMRPPNPAATLEFKSPNSCNICHGDKDAVWADKVVREWYPAGEHRSANIKTARLIAAARNRDWSRLPEMISFIQTKGRDEVFAASLLRMLKRCDDEKIPPVLLSALKDTSPLVRAAAAESLAHKTSADHARALTEAAQDSYRLVRIKAAASLSEYPKQMRSKDGEKGITIAFKEYRDFLLLEPDKWQSWFSVGNMHLKLDQFKDAVAAYREAMKLDPKSVKTLLSLSTAQSLAGDAEGAAKTLADAIALEPENEAATNQTGKLKYGKVALEQAKNTFIKMIADDPKSARGAYGLCMITESDRLAESLKWCKTAMENSPDDPKSSFAFARSLSRAGRIMEAESILVQLDNKFPAFEAHYALLSDIYKRLGKHEESEKVKARIKYNFAGTASSARCGTTVNTGIVR